MAEAVPPSAAEADLPVTLAAAGPGAVAAWEEFVSNARYAPTTLAAFRRNARRFLDWLDGRGLRLAQVTSAVVQEFLDARGISPVSQYSDRRALGRLFAALTRHGVVPGVPDLLPTTRYDYLAGPAADNRGSLADEFARLTPVERQATVDAALVALIMHEVHVFTGGAGGQEADPDRCEEALRLGEEYGIMPLSWDDAPDASTAPGDKDPVGG